MSVLKTGGIPLYFMGLVLASSAILAELLALKRGNWRGSELALSFTLASGFLPTPPGFAPRESIYPLNTPAWSLAFELIVNLAFVAAWKRLSTKVLIAVVITAGAALAATAQTFGSLAAGSDWSTVAGGFPRVFYSFTVGVLTLRLFRKHEVSFSLGWVAPVLATLAILTIEPPPGLRPAYDVIAVLFLFPLLVLWGANAKPTRIAGFCGWMGSISYALYALHFPIFEMAFALLKRLMPDKFMTLQPWAGYAFMALILGVAHAADFAYDAPVRKWLTLKTGRTAKTAVETL